MMPAREDAMPCVAERVHQPLLHVVHFLISSSLLGLGGAGCIMEDSKCSEHQVFVGGWQYKCVCDTGYVPSARGYGCDPCGEHEVAVGSVCECAVGYDRVNPMSPCEAITGSLPGQACSSAEPCVNPNPFCATDGSESYCTKSGCTRSDDCPTNWRCVTSATPPFCEKPPTGLGNTCMSTANCAGFEAGYCEVFLAKVCMVNGCVGTNNCPSGSACCDLPTLLMTSLCIPRSNLGAGGMMCPDGSPPVTP